MSNRRAKPGARHAQHRLAPPSVSELLASLTAAADALAVAVRAERGPETPVRVSIDLAPCVSVVVQAWPPSASAWVDVARWTHEPALRAGAVTNYPEPVPPAAGLHLVHPCPAAMVQGFFGPSHMASQPAVRFGGVVFDHFHDGLDLYARTGTPVVAAASGTVAHTDDASGHVAIVAADGQTLTEYGHMSVPLELRVGDQVQAGDGVGAIDNTATNGGPPHLHFKLQTAGGPVDPLPWLLAGRLPLEEPPAGS